VNKRSKERKEVRGVWMGDSSILCEESQRLEERIGFGVLVAFCVLFAWSSLGYFILFDQRNQLVFIFTVF
jgi:hypothetical protein